MRGQKTTFAQNNWQRKISKLPLPKHSDRTASHPILQLQQSLGNQAVARMLQAKLKIGPPGDKYEQEADRVADAVMSMPEPKIQRKPT